MYNKLKFLVAVALVLPLFSFVSVYAHIGNGEVLNETTENKTTSESTNDKQPDTSAQGIADRLAKKKAALQTKINAAEQAKIKTRCQAAQGMVKNLQGRINGIQTSRTNVYNNTITRLNSLAEKLKAVNIDTAQLESQITELQNKIDVFKTDLSEYEQAVSDLASMDCTADPTAFKAALEAARAARQTVSSDVKDIRAYINETIKETIKQLKQQLEQTNLNQ